MPETGGSHWLVRLLNSWDDEHSRRKAGREQRFLLVKKRDAAVQHMINAIRYLDHEHDAMQPGGDVGDYEACVLISCCLARVL